MVFQLFCSTILVGSCALDRLVHFPRGVLRCVNTVGLLQRSILVLQGYTWVLPEPMLLLWMLASQPYVHTC